mmetsp:Transcript_48367/g.55795  ORF Transcript_48367/g.55795 Transcript_48367/m.55795 type:complete len:151 (-) Transcript_48367:392-844(-)
MVHFARLLVQASFLFASVSASSRTASSSTTTTAATASTPTVQSLSVTDQVTGMKGLMLGLHEQASIQNHYPKKEQHADVKNQDYYNEFIFDKVVEKLMVNAAKEIKHYVENYSIKHSFHSDGIGATHRMWEGLYIASEEDKDRMRRNEGM